MLTVVVPVWGSYIKYLPECLESLNKFKLTNVVIVDNCSNPPVEQILKNGSVVRLPARTSVGEARNKGLEYVNTPWVIFLDADDILNDDPLKLINEAGHKSAAVVGRSWLWDGTRITGISDWPR